MLRGDVSGDNGGETDEHRHGPGRGPGRTHDDVNVSDSASVESGIGRRRMSGFGSPQDLVVLNGDDGEGDNDCDDHGDRQGGVDVRPDVDVWSGCDMDVEDGPARAGPASMVRSGPGSGSLRSRSGASPDHAAHQGHGSYGHGHRHVHPEHGHGHGQKEVNGHERVHGHDHLHGHAHGLVNGHDHGHELVNGGEHVDNHANGLKHGNGYGHDRLGHLEDATLEGESEGRRGRQRKRMACVAGAASGLTMGLDSEMGLGMGMGIGVGRGVSCLRGVGVGAGEGDGGDVMEL